MRIKIIVIIGFFGLVSGNLCAQELGRSVISVMGQVSFGNKYKMSQTVGEPFASTIFANYRYFTQGFQQPELLNPRNPGDETYDAIDVYPNPVTRSSQYILTVSFRINELSDYVIEIFDTQGRRLYFDELNRLYSQEIKIDLSGFRQSIYFVHVFSVNRRMDRYFKIEKF